MHDYFFTFSLGTSLKGSSEVLFGTDDKHMARVLQKSQGVRPVSGFSPQCIETQRCVQKGALASVAFSKWHSISQVKNLHQLGREEVRLNVVNAMGSLFLWVGQTSNVPCFSSRN